MPFSQPLSRNWSAQDEHPATEPPNPRMQPTDLAPEKWTLG
jgi:hypothetical protein